MSKFMKTRPYTLKGDNLSDLVGNHILAHYDEHSVVLYQTVYPDIAKFAVAKGYFGGPYFQFDKMKYIQTSFLRTMNDSEWCSNQGSERLLAIKLEKHHFEDILKTASSGTMYQTPPGKVVSESIRLLWKPDCNLNGKPLKRNTLVIGIHGEMLRKFNSRFIEAIQDITEFVKEQHKYILEDDMSNVIVPEENLYIPENNDVCRRIMLNGFYIAPDMDTLEDMKELEKVKKCQMHHSTRKAMLFFQGSFNPIHANHVQAMIECKHWMENNTNFEVVAGVMAVNCDERLMLKFEGKDDLKIKSKHRVEMCKVATASHQWIHTYDLLTTNTCAKEVQKQVEYKHGRGVKWFHVYGADRAVKLLRRGLNCYSIIVGRQGETDRMRKMFNDAVKNGKMDTDTVFIIPVTLHDVSSTYIRTRLNIMTCKSSKEDKVEDLQDLVESKWLDENVVEYLVENELDLYL